jgi:DNA repair protein RecO (recombination protein O)
LQRLASDEPLAWSLRRFERDLLQAMGYALQLEHDAETGEPLDPQAHYEYRVEQGAVACLPGRRPVLRGSDLLALAHDRIPDDEGLKALRGMMRQVIRFHLGGGELRAWRVLGGATSWR